MRQPNDSPDTLRAPRLTSEVLSLAEPWALRVVASVQPRGTNRLVTLEDVLVLGRSTGGEGISLDDPHLSRSHVRLVVDEEGGLMLQDLGSTNGTYVNGRQVDTVKLNEGDVIRIGSTLLVTTRESDKERVENAEQGVVGDSPAFRSACGRAILGAGSQLPVLILGETGTGKEVLARLAHRHSGRRGPFVAVNCAAIPHDLADALLFGHQAGAFTGADRARRGLFREAEGGTLFLDEVGDLPGPLQSRLLRALDQQEVLPVGASRPLHVNVRVIAATNAHLQSAVEAGTFRGDLFARLAAWRITLPPLRERREDVLRLARHFAGFLPEPERGEEPLWTPDFAEALLLYPWPFNVRELRQLMASLSVAGQERPYRANMLPRDVLDATRESIPTPAKAPSERSQAPNPVTTEVRRRPSPSRDDLVALLQRHGNNISGVARALNRDRKQIYRWLERYRIDLHDLAS